MQDDFIQDDQPEPPRVGAWSGLLRRIRAQQVPAPFRDSDFESHEDRWSPAQAQRGNAE